MLEDKINQDLKSALLGGDKVLATTLRGLKSSLLYAKIANNSRDKAMSDEEVIAVFQKEAKKRQESADLYLQGGNHERAEAELVEKAVISKYLPSQLADEEVAKLVDAAIATLTSSGQPTMGAVIGIVKAQAAGRADGAVIARIAKDRLESRA